MLSVCIPTYRYDVRPLIAELQLQARERKGKVEILVYDDASPADGYYGRADLRNAVGVRYVELSENLGRAAIRNRMAREATYPYLLLLDADGQVHTKFLRTYILHLADVIARQKSPRSNIVLVGGREYAAVPPEDERLQLHWWYGTRRESRSVHLRKRAGWLGFQSNNFLISQHLLLDHPFPEEVAGYGHEDTLWGQQMERAGVPIYHIDNPVVHLGLEPEDVFLGKQREAIRNLALLHQQFPHLRTRLIDLAEKYPSAKHLVQFFPESWLARRLTDSKRPSIYWLDILKLRWWYAEQN